MSTTLIPATFNRMSKSAQIIAAREQAIPQALEAEMSALGAMLIQESAAAAAMTVLHATDFYRGTHRKLFEVLAAMYGEGQLIDFITAAEAARQKGILDELGGAGYLQVLIESCPGAANIESYAEAVLEASKRRQLIVAAEQIKTLAYDGGESADELMTRAEQTIFDVGRDQRNEGFVTSAELVSASMLRMEKAAENKGSVTGLATGFDEFDRMSNGLQPSSLTILGAAPSMGKTALALNIAANVGKAGGKVAVFSLEMARDELMHRMVCAEAGLNGNDVARGFVQPDEWLTIRDAHERLHYAPLFINDDAGLTPVEMRSLMRRLSAERGGIDLIIVDYLQLCRMPHDKSRPVSRVQEMGDVARALKVMAKENRCPVLAISSLSRAAMQREDKRPMMSDLRESGDIEFAADTVLLLYREDYYNRSGEAVRPAGVAELIIGKQRNGPTGRVELLFQREYARFVNYLGRWAHPELEQ